MIIVGEKEVENQTVTIRRRFVKEQKELSLQEFSKDILSEIKERRVSN
jgi:threonyl-tRNA synthetase